MKLTMDLGARAYDITVERGALNRVGPLLDLDRKCLIVTGSVMPRVYAETVAAQCKVPTIVTVPSGETAKSFPVYQSLCQELLRLDFHLMLTHPRVLVGPKYWKSNMQILLQLEKSSSIPKPWRLIERSISSFGDPMMLYGLFFFFF